MEYDLNGNIIHLKRSGDANQGTTANLIDELNYEYQGNRVTSIVDERNNYQGYPDVSGNTIDYNDNGDMTSQKDKGILQIDYNHLNLADYFQFNTSYVIRNPLTGQNEVRNVKLDYLYRADGLKLRKKYTYFFSKGSTERLTVTDYLDGFQYTISHNGRTSLDFISTSEGYFDFRQNKYIYNYTDHLGNVRLSYFNNGSSTEVLEENNYYPFGLKHGGYNEVGGNPAYQYKYNGKELQTETGMYDYGARFYMPDIGRWGVVDPLAETSRRWNPYTYAYDNPIMFVDPDGREAERCCKYLKDAWSGFKQESKNIVLGGLQLAVRPGKVIGTTIGGAINDAKAGKYSSAADKITNLTHMGTTDMVKNAFSAIKGDGKALGALGAQGLAVAEGTGRIAGAGRGLRAVETESSTSSLNGSQLSRSQMSTIVGEGAMDGKRLGHTFTKHGIENTNQLQLQAENSGIAQGQWIDNLAAEQIIFDNLENLKNGAITVPIPEGVGRVINPNGTISPATHARLVPSGSGVKTAYPLNP